MYEQGFFKNVDIKSLKTSIKNHAYIVLFHLTSSISHIPPILQTAQVELKIQK